MIYENHTGGTGPGISSSCVLFPFSAPPEGPARGGYVFALICISSRPRADRERARQLMPSRPVRSFTVRIRPWLGTGGGKKRHEK